MSTREELFFAMLQMKARRYRIAVLEAYGSRMERKTEVGSQFFLETRNDPEVSGLRSAAQ